VQPERESASSQVDLDSKATPDEQDPISGPVDLDTADIWNDSGDVWKSNAFPKSHSTETRSTVATNEDDPPSDSQFAVQLSRSTASTILTREEEIKACHSTDETQHAVRSLKSDASTIASHTEEVISSQQRYLGSGWDKVNYQFAGILLLFYICLVGGLAYALYAIHEAHNDGSLNGAPGATPANITSDPGRNFGLTFKPTLQDTSPPAISPPSALGPTLTPSSSTAKDLPTRAPTKRPNPTESPSRKPTSTPIYISYAEEMYFKEIIEKVNPLFWNMTRVTNSPQQQELNWLVADPNFFEYKKHRLIQRYALAVTKLPIIQTPQEALDYSWMEYTNECTWFTSWYLNIVSCDADDHFRNLILRNMILRNIGLDGTIHEELTLLTRLRFLILTAN
jgi:hypothetical protein